MVLLQAVKAALAKLAGPDFQAAFGGSTDQDDYRWGRLHRVTLDHPLGGPFNIPPAFGAFPPPLADLPGIPTDGGFETVDASTHNARADATGEFGFGGGPANRYVASPWPWRHPRRPRPWRHQRRSWHAVLRQPAAGVADQRQLHPEPGAAA